eukprot:CAMPEP_0170459934 /NCGR_PEP_ID=MMETSP0123-20130129/6463_1 /TAXON_ID=182087 /ORGANISM="Favella ehrenbergii, Strain Fehren 1" /LENGTH=76 /DNA_ID=CAMNT_0010724697 /DNA_START=1803 /DNA_END=2033 /DNA_ORIENTATION=-
MCLHGFQAAKSTELGSPTATWRFYGPGCLSNSRPSSYSSFDSVRAFAAAVAVAAATPTAATSSASSTRASRLSRQV